ncbi:MAG: DUF2993 domain-containing protein [Cyanobacteriota bacterium]
MITGITGIDNLGEQALAKMAQMALSNQLNEAEQLKILVKTDPGKLAQGELEWLEIDGKGLVMRESLRMQEMELKINDIAVCPIKALMGNIELTKPIEGTARIVVTQEDINYAFNSELLANQMRDLNIQADGKVVKMGIERVTCQLLANGTVEIDADILLQQTGETQQVSFTTTPDISTDGRTVMLKEVQYVEGKELSPEITSILLQKAKAILNLRNFEMQGISLCIHQLEVTEGLLTLQAAANVTKFPST